MKGKEMDEKEQLFGKFIKEKRLNDPRELTLKDVSNALGLSLSMLSDIEQGRRKAFDDDRIIKFCEYLNLDENALREMRDYAAFCKHKIPADIEETMLHSEIGSMARHALRLANEGYGDEEDWKKFIWQLEEKKRNDA